MGAAPVVQEPMIGEYGAFASPQPARQYCLGVLIERMSPPPKIPARPQAPGFSKRVSLQPVRVRRQRQVIRAALALRAMLIRSSSERLMLTRCRSHDGKISRSPVTGGITMAWPVKALKLATISFEMV